jgi:plastocyanin
MKSFVFRSLALLGLSLAAAPASAHADAPPPSASVTISDSGVSPRSVTVLAGGSIMWTNAGNTVHTATSLPGAVLTFDTGGLGHGQANTATFGTPGTYNYSSFIDCLNGNNIPGFDCGPYTVVVVAPGQTAVGVAPATSPNVAVTIDDTSGFQPGNIVVQAGQTVVWTNTGAKVHTVTQDGGFYLPGFDSGGLATGQSLSYTFNAPTLVKYHSATEPVYIQDPNSPATTIATFAFRGIITVVPAGTQPIPSPAPPPAPSYSFASKDVAAPPAVCGAGQRVPCVASAPNSGTQYVQGHVLDKNGQGLGGLFVQLTSNGGSAARTVSTDQDGLFTIVLFTPSFTADTHCPVFPSYVPRTFQVWLTDASGSVVSDTRAFQYFDCSTAGEFHFDFLRQS